MELFIVVFRTLFFYFFVTFSYRIMGKREVGQLGIIDLIVSILIAELVAISIENTNDSIMLTIAPISILVIVEIVLAYLSIKSTKVRSVMQGKPSLIICNGKINYQEMIKQRYTIDDLLLNLRQNQVKSVEDVEYAFIESNGKLSIFKYDLSLPKHLFPLPIIVDGKIEDEYLDKIPYNKKEILHMINSKNINIENIFYGFYKDKKIFISLKNSESNYLDNKYLRKSQK